MHHRPLVTLLARPAEVGASDCERIADQLLAQPVNALSSLVFVVVAIVIVTWESRRTRSDPLAIAYGLSLAAVGLGSLAFHGPQPPGSQFVHDVPIVFVLLLMVLHDWTLLRPGARWTAPFAIGAFAAVVVSALVPAAAGVLAGMLAVALVVAEVLVFRRGARPGDRDRQVRCYLAIGAVLAVAGGLWVLGRTGSPTCDPESLLQLHGLWHLASALAFALWWWVALGPGRWGTGRGADSEGSAPVEAWQDLSS